MPSLRSGTSALVSRYLKCPFRGICAGMNIDNEVVEDLIELGREGIPQVPGSLKDVQDAQELLMRGWTRIGRRLEEQRLRFLIMGLVLYSQASGWTGGSVSPVIQLYKEFAERFPGSDLALNQWIVANRRNPYEPFGSLMIGGRTLREHQANWVEYRRSREEELQRRELVRLGKVGAVATTKLPNAVRRGDILAVKALIAKGADPKVRDHAGRDLHSIAASEGRTAISEFLRELEMRPDVGMD
jgi:hypothetical protein